MSGARHSHCTFCGAAYAAELPWPRTCPRCANTSYLNPLPVAVALVPVAGGLLTVRRAVEPRTGMLALPGGFIELGESWQAACAREVAEETGLQIDAARVVEYRVRSAPDGTLLVFGLAAPLAGDLPAWAPRPEASGLVVLTEPAELAFPLHTEVAALWFAER